MTMKHTDEKTLRAKIRTNMLLMGVPPKAVEDAMDAAFGITRSVVAAYAEAVAHLVDAAGVSEEACATTNTAAHLATFLISTRLEYLGELQATLMEASGVPSATFDPFK